MFVFVRAYVLLLMVTHKGVKWCLKYITQIQQQRPKSPTVTLTWHACKHKVQKLHLRYILLDYGNKWCVYLCVRACVRVCVCVCGGVGGVHCVCMCVCVNVYVHIYIYMHVCVGVGECMCAYACVCECVQHLQGNGASMFMLKVKNFFPSSWQMSFSQSAPAYKHTSLDKPVGLHIYHCTVNKACALAVLKKQWSCTLGLYSSKQEFKHTLCSLLHLFKWVELSG